MKARYINLKTERHLFIYKITRFKELMLCSENSKMSDPIEICEQNIHIMLMEFKILELLNQGEMAYEKKS